MLKKLSYYNYDKLLSYNATYNICVGGRGLGKTFGAKRKAIREAIRTFNPDTGYCNQFIYLRRYKPEIRLSKETFFADIYHEFPDWDFRTIGSLGQMASIETRDEKNRSWYTIGYFLPLVTSQHYKGVSFPAVTTIIFDEFIIETGLIRYLPNETVVFNNFYSTVDRYKDKTRVYFLANSVSITNPYFVDWDLNPRSSDSNGIVKAFKGFIVAHFVDSAEFNSQAYETIFGRFIKGTEYATYAVENQFADNHDALIKPKGTNAEYKFTLETKISIFSVWYDLYTAEWYCQEKRPRGDEIFFTMDPEKMDKYKTLVAWKDKPLAMLRNAFKNGRMTFDKPLTRNSFIEIFKQ
jgi:hypothetical protein